MRRSEIRENLFKMVFCVEFHPGEDVDEQRDVYLEQIPELTGEEFQQLETALDRCKVYGHRGFTSLR